MLLAWGDSDHFSFNLNRMFASFICTYLRDIWLLDAESAYHRANIAAILCEYIE